MEEDMSKKEKKEKIDEKPFNLEDFYRKLGVALLTLLLVLILIFGAIMLRIQNKILEQTNINFIEKNKVNIINPNEIALPIDEVNDINNDNIDPTELEETEALDGPNVTE